MKKIVVLSLLAVMLTGCVKQADYDDLVKQNAKLESKVESLEEENDELRDEIKKLKETPVTNVTEEPVETPKETNATPSPDGSLIEVYNKTLTNPESGSSIEMKIYFDTDFHILSTYYMPPNSYFEDNYKAEAASALYSLFILTLGEYSSYYLSMTECDSYYSTIIFSSEDNDTGYTFSATDRNHKPCYSIDECDWFSEYQNHPDSENDKYNSQETTWITETFFSIGDELINISEQYEGTK